MTLILKACISLEPGQIETWILQKGVAYNQFVLKFIDNRKMKQKEEKADEFR